MTATVVDAAPIVDIVNLQVVFPRSDRLIQAVRGLDLRIGRGEAVGIVGESGSGKSVTVRSLLGLAGTGAIVEADRFDLFGRPALGQSERAWRRLRGGRIGLVLQDALVSLDPLRTVRAEIDEVLRRHRPGSAAQRAARVKQLLDDVGMDEPALRSRQRPHQLSGGLRQRALIASAVAGDPDLIVADEPTTALDVTVQAQVLALLAARRAADTALLLVSHDLAVVAKVCDRVIVMKDGVAVEEGPTDQVLAAPAVAYTRQLLASVPSAASRGRTLSLTQPQPLPARRRQADRTVLRAERLSRDFNAPGGAVCHAVRSVSLTVAAGETLGLVGESGSGKSTVAKLLAGLLEPGQGQVWLDGQLWAPLSDRGRLARRRQIQLIAQDPLSSFDPRYSAEQILAEPLRRDRLGRSEIARQINRVLDLVHLSQALLNSSPRTFSGGERQRLAIARALIAQPAVLIADEPVSALDVSVQAQILDLLAQVQAETAASLVFISHDLGVVHHLADRVLVMKDGLVVESGPADDVFRCPSHPYTQELLAALPQLPASAAACQPAL
ncbi:MAG: ABC transporter ATP-binding protein [Propionibacteriaceae bacterium]|jgi:peptide/nickel transport system ATP-binding protein|nr:ABC transporter ATP-binding protein [Propionibacteriaceae bacterium]